MQVLYKVISEPWLGLTNVEEDTSGAADTVDHIDGCAGEPLSDMEGLFGALNGSDDGDFGAEDVHEILNEYFALVFTQEKDIEDSEICVEHANMLRHFGIKKEVVFGLLKSIKLKKVINEDRAVDVVYMEFSKAFKKVPHDKHIQKIKMHGVHAIWIQKWLVHGAIDGDGTYEFGIYGKGF
eukprot:g44518.t1